MTADPGQEILPFVLDEIGAIKREAVAAQAGLVPDGNPGHVGGRVSLVGRAAGSAAAAADVDETGTGGCEEWS